MSGGRIRLVDATTCKSLRSNLVIGRVETAATAAGVLLRQCTPEQKAGFMDPGPERCGGGKRQYLAVGVGVQTCMCIHGSTNTEHGLLAAGVADRGSTLPSGSVNMWWVCAMAAPMHSMTHNGRLRQDESAIDLFCQLLHLAVGVSVQAVGARHGGRDAHVRQNDLPLLIDQDVARLRAMKPRKKLSVTA